MQKLIISFVLTFLFVSAVVTAQTDIQFSSGSWKEILDEAKRLEKPVFVDVYTSWCGPCKQMSKNVFTQKEVADKFNASFINYKIDAEKGEGVELAAKYKVTAYPTYLFVDGNGNLVYKSSGSMPAERFINEAGIALNEYKDPKPLAVWEEAYQSKKNDVEFLFEYLNKRKKQRLNSADILDQIFLLVGKSSVERQEFLADMGMFIYMNTDGPLYNYLKSERAFVANLYEQRMKRKFQIDAFLIAVAKNDVDRAILNNDVELLKKIEAHLLSFPPDPKDEYPVEWRGMEARMKFYTQNKERKALTDVLKKYTTSVLAYDVQKIKYRDSLALDAFDKDVAAGKLKFSTQEALQISRNARANYQLTIYAYKIREIVRSVFQVIDEKKMLTQSLDLINQALTYSQNFTLFEAKAGVQYKLGKSVDALETQSIALAELQKTLAKLSVGNEKALNRINSNMEKMKKGEPTWTVFDDEVSGRVSTSKKQKN
ncbi:MAG: thioredoxin family protein [Chitinophagales bacterium]|nr:thioredoxin family protein [Chitinophagales bacterium]